MDDAEIQKVLKVDCLCNSLSGVQVPILTITDKGESSIPEHRKQYVICTARVHPGESNGSFMIEGFIKFICSQEPQAI